MLLKDMAQHVVDVVGSPDTESVAMAKKFLKRRYEMIYDSHLWEDAKTALSLGTYGPEIILPTWVDRVIQVVEAKDGFERNLPHMDLQNVFQVQPSLLEDEGEVVGFTRKRPVATHTHPFGVKIKIKSSDTNDTSNVRVQGTHNGNEISETITLNRNVYVESANYYDEIASLSKEKTNGFIRVVKSNTAENEVQVLLEDENERKHQRIELLRNFPDDESEGRKLLVLAKHICVPLIHDNDAPQLTSCVNALISFATADLLNRMRQAGKAQIHIQEANAHVASMMDRDKNQQASVVRFIPDEM